MAEEPHATLEACTILHVDLDAFFAAVEILDEPSLAGKPVVVGGMGRRGVVASCTYEARAFGVRSAMAVAEARRRCPHAVYLPGRYGRYSELSGRFHQVLASVTPKIEGIGLDEAFLDVAGARRLLGSPDVIAKQLRADVFAQLGLRCAVGVARSKLVAKLASRAAKPRVDGRKVLPGRGVVTVAPHQERAFLHPLPVRAIWGVGPATYRRLESVGLKTVADVAAAPEQALVRLLGPAQGRQLHRLARGVDERVVEWDRTAKSVSHEETFPFDLHTHDDLRPHLLKMADAVSARLQEAKLAGRTVSLKLRHADLSITTRSHSLSSPVDGAHVIATVAGALLDGCDPSGGVRLIGVAVGSLQTASTGRQLTFDDGPARPGRWDEIEGAVAAIRARYGQRSVGPAALVGPDGLGVKGRGDSQWGPAEGGG